MTLPDTYACRSFIESMPERILNQRELASQRTTDISVKRIKLNFDCLLCMAFAFFATDFDITKKRTGSASGKVEGNGINLEMGFRIPPQSFPPSSSSGFTPNCIQYQTVSLQFCSVFVFCHL